MSTKILHAQDAFVCFGDRCLDNGGFSDGRGVMDW